jgi:hypothetical protein
VCTSSRAFQAGGGYLQSSPHEGLFPLRRGSSLCQQLVQFGGLEIDTPGDGVSAAHYARLSVPQLLKVIARPLHTLLEIEACCAALAVEISTYCFNFRFRRKGRGPCSVWPVDLVKIAMTCRDNQLNQLRLQRTRY